MKKSVITLAAIVVAASAFGQGQIALNNRQTVDQGLGLVNSPIFGSEGIGLPQKIGGTATGNPAGTTEYTGARLDGSGFTAQLWFASGVGQSESALQPADGLTSFRTGTGAGYLLTGGIATLPGVTAGRVTLQLRVWDNQGGTVNSWTEALARAPQGLAHGASALFSPTQPVGFGTVQPPVLEGMTSFNLMQVPEPSTIALGILGGLGTLLLIRRRK